MDVNRVYEEDASLSVVLPHLLDVPLELCSEEKNKRSKYLITIEREERR